MEEWIEDINKNIYDKDDFPGIHRVEHYLNCKYKIQFNFLASHLHKDPLSYLGEKTLIEPRHSGFIYSNNSFMIIFPNEGVRISCLQGFINTVPYLKQIFSGNWKDKTLQLSFKDGLLDKDINGPLLYVCYSPLEMLIYDKVPEKIQKSRTFNQFTDINIDFKDNYYIHNDLLGSICNSIYS